jgi:hypothetical protein
VNETALAPTGMENPLRDFHAGSEPGPFNTPINRPAN